MRWIFPLFLLISGAAIAQPPPSAFGPGPTPCVGTSGNIAIFTAGGACGDSQTALGAVQAPLFGFGTDGNVAISSGTTTLTRDMHYANLTLSGTGAIKTSGFRIYVAGTLDISAAQTGAITGSSVAGGNASGATGGTAGTIPYNTAASVPTTPLTLGAGGTGNATTGTNPTQANATTQTGVSGSGGAGGNGGAGTSAAGAGLVGQRFNSATFNLGAVFPGASPGNGFPIGTFPTAIGFFGAPGGQGGGDGTNAGGGGGGIPSAPGAVFVAARIIQRGNNANAGVMQSIGGNGGNGGNAAGGNAGGGGGAGGASGGIVFIQTQTLLGSTITNGLDASGGTGGTGGNGAGTGKGGTGGTGGGAGAIDIVNIGASTATVMQTITGGSAATTASTTAGTVGGAGVTVQGNL